MKKLLLSFAVIAASGAYVVAERNDGNQAVPDVRGSASLAAPATERANALAPPPATMQSRSSGAGRSLGSIASVTAPGQPLSKRAAPAMARRASISPPIKSPEPKSDSSVAVAEIAPVQVPGLPKVGTDATPAQALPPLPRQRPEDLPQPAAELAQAAPAGRQGQYVNGTYRGSSADAYYGRVQVSAVVSGGQITSIDVLQYPNDRGRSRRINGYALPMLEQEVIAAQSADVDIVSGATLTSEAYMKSLASALAKAGDNNA